MPKVHALIPARAGSGRLGNKNVLPFHGRPLYQWTLDFALDCGVFDRVFVSTDIEELQREAQGRAELMERPAELASSDATLLEVIQHSIQLYALDPDSLLVLLPVTGPLRVKGDLNEALQKFHTNDGHRRVVPVSPNLHPPALLWEIEDDCLKPRETSDDPKFTQKHKHRLTYLWNDLFVLDSCRNWLRSDSNLYGERPVPLEIPAERCMPIDYPVQFRLAEALFPPVDERTGKKEWQL